MRFFEFLIPLTLAIYILWSLISGVKNPFLVNFLSVIAAIEVVAHLLFKGYRWQMIPVYILTGLILWTTFPELREPKLGEFNRRSWSAVGMFPILKILIFSLLLSMLLPVPKIPPPKGKYEH